MGLDANGGKLNHTYEVEFENQQGEKVKHKWVGVGHFEWRKHARLQEFMTRLYMKRYRIKNKWIERDDGWYPIEFGKYNRIRLKEEDIDKLEEAIKDDYEEYFCEGGFLWGHQRQETYMNAYREQDLEFIDYAKQRLKDNKRVYYSCSW